MTIVPYQADHLMELKLQTGQGHCLPFVTRSHAEALQDEYAFTALVDGHPIAVGGVKELFPGRALCWAFIGKDSGPHFPALHKAVKTVLDFVPYRRLEADVACEFEQGHRWAKMLGFTMEAERMVAHRIDGGDNSLYARVR